MTTSGWGSRPLISCLKACVSFQAILSVLRPPADTGLTGLTFDTINQLLAVTGSQLMAPHEVLGVQRSSRSSLCDGATSASCLPNRGSQIAAATWAVHLAALALQQAAKPAHKGAPGISGPPAKRRRLTVGDSNGDSHARDVEKLVCVAWQVIDAASRVRATARLLTC